MATIETKLQWRKANDRPTKDCTILVLVNSKLFGCPICYTTDYHAKWGEDVKFSGEKVIGWAELDFVGLGIRLTSNFDEEWIGSLHDNAYNKAFAKDNQEMLKDELINEIKTKNPNISDNDIDDIFSKISYQDIIDEYDIDGMRVCSHCGKLMNEGYCIESGMAYYCSDECLHANMTEEEYLELYDEGDGDTYYTQWY